MHAMVVVHRNANLFELICALGPPGGRSGRLDRWQQQSNQDSDDRDHNQQLD